MSQCFPTPRRHRALLARTLALFWRLWRGIEAITPAIAPYRPPNTLKKPRRPYDGGGYAVVLGRFRCGFAVSVPAGAVSAPVVKVWLISASTPGGRRCASSRFDMSLRHR